MLRRRDWRLRRELLALFVVRLYDCLAVEVRVLVLVELDQYLVGEACGEESRGPLDSDDAREERIDLSASNGRNGTSRGCVGGCSGGGGGGGSGSGGGGGNVGGRMQCGQFVGGPTRGRER